MIKLDLGTLGEVDLREVWPDEAKGFTPWLSWNLDLLGNALGLQLKLAEVEHPVGQYSLDILAEEADGGNVAIENQLEWSDHSHLGQLLIYSAWCEAEYVVWIAKHFTAQHRAAINWLNALNPDKVWFYAVEIRVVKIEGSLPAVDFHVIAAPKEWWRTIPEPVRPPSPYQSFFLPLIEDLGALGIRHLEHFPSYPEDYYQWFDLGGQGCYELSLCDGYAQISSVIDTQTDPDTNGPIFDRLIEQREQIEGSLSGSWDWERDGSGGTCLVGIRIPGDISDSSEKLEEIRNWVLEALPKLGAELNPRLEQIFTDLEI